MILEHSQTPAKILIVDDHPAVREALAFRVNRQSDMTICGEASDSIEALRIIKESEPHLAVVDITLKNGNGIDLIKRIRDQGSELRILVWSMHSESLYAERALRAGAAGYVNKDQATEQIIEAIRRVLSGKVYLSEAMAEKLLQRTVGVKRNGSITSTVDTLADRELEVFRLIGEGIKTAEIAKRLHLSVKTIETYRLRIKQKLALADGAELASFAARWLMDNP